MSKPKVDNKFIGAFVNEMYAILLGIGIGNILFIQKLDISSLFEVAMGLFVTMVILIYWWDWTDFISDNVVTSKREFIIDFLILINLEVLFLVYNQPQTMAMVFVVLGILDMLWVINFTYQNGSNFIASAKRWLLDKLFGIIVPLGIWFALKYLLTDFHDLIQGGMVIAAYALTRLVGFRQLSKSTTYQLFIAENEDYKSIAEINNSYLNPEGKNTFMISALSKDKIEARIKDGNQFYVLKTQTEGEVLGFVELAMGISKDIVPEISWTSRDDLDKYNNPNNKFRYIEKVAVSKEYRKKGIGKSIYKNLFCQFADYSFYAFVMAAPHKNEVSIGFHRKMNFKIAGIYEQSEYAGFKNYKSYLFYSG